MPEMPSFSSPLSYSWSAASTQRPKSPPPPPSTQKRDESRMQTPSILLRALENGSPQPQNGEVQQLLHYIDNLSFSSAGINNEHSLYVQEQDKDVAKRENTSFQSPKVSVLQNRSMNHHSKDYNLPDDVIVKSQAFPEFTPIRKISSPQRSPPSPKTSVRLDPVGATPLKAKENLLHETSRYIYTREEEPIGSSPMRSNERHLFQSSRHYLSDEESSGSSLIPHGQLERTRASSSFFATKTDKCPIKSLSPTPSRRRQNPESGTSPRKSLEASLEHSMDEAWSIVLGTTIIEEKEAEDQKNEVKLMAASKKDHLVQGPMTPAISRSSNILENLPDNVKSPEDAKKLLRTAVHTLQDARAERESARQWATEMKDAVHKWVEQQRQLMKTESTITQSDAWQQSQLQSLSNLEGSIQKLCREVYSSNQQRTSTEEKLHHLLIEQREKIQSMAEEVVSMKQQIQQMEQQVTQPAHKTNTPKSKENDEATPKSSSKSKLETPSRSTTSSTASSRVRKEGKDGGHIIIYGNGVRKEVHKDGTTVIRFTNGDVETKFSGGTTAYFHAKDRVMQINNTADGSTLFEYPNRQIERHYKDGSKAILFTDGTRQRISAQGKVDTAFVKT